MDHDEALPYNGKGTPVADFEADLQWVEATFRILNDLNLLSFLQVDPLLAGVSMTSYAVPFGDNDS